MASPTEAEVQTQIGNAIIILDDLHQFGGINANNVAGRADTLIASIETEFAPEVLAGLRAYRNQLSQALTPAIGRAMLDPLWRELARVKGYSETDPVAIIRRYRDEESGVSVNSRGLTYGTPTFSGATGDGVINRLTVDQYNEPLENITVEAKSAKCIEDEHSGATEHEELFLVRGADAAVDLLAVNGSGLSVTLGALSARASEQFVENPSFANFAGETATPTEITNWTVGSNISNFEVDQTNFYRDYEGEGTAAALKIDAADSLEQNLNVRGAQFNPRVPYYCQVAVNPTVYSASGGTFTLTLGSVTASSLLSGLSSGWNIIRIAIGQNNWFKNWNQEDPLVKVEWSSASSGSLLVDDLILAPYTLIDGTWYAIVGGATPFLRDDNATWTDSVSTEVKIQYWLWRMYGEYLRSDNSGTETWADPS